ncbi:Uma2 family endonuclease [Tautonia sp. JC769]|uniref:Uma2 family endonuclease n=1 Tax=Tautonia sp. JC769 TaxID=3232135 RepID=UPI0034581DCF
MVIAAESIETMDDLLERIGNVPLSRIRAKPAPGTATEADVIAAKQSLNRRCELVEGVLVEKAMGFKESVLGLELGMLLKLFVKARRLGLVAGADGFVRLMPGLVRIPDLAFVSWDRLPGRKIPDAPIPDLAPDLVVEILSPSNTKAEMTLKRRNYLDAGVRLIWFVDPGSRTVLVIHHDREDRLLGQADRLDGDEILPGFSVQLEELFAELDQTGN